MNEEGDQQLRDEFGAIWKTLSAVNVNDHVKKIGPAKLSYLSWAWAWGTLMEHYPEATYCVERDPLRMADGSMEVHCSVYIGACIRDMWLPVMDNRHNSIMNPSSRQVSDAKMRCLTKCLAMFGLGHYIYAGEDLPDIPEDQGTQGENQPEPVATETKAAEPDPIPEPEGEIKTLNSAQQQVEVIVSTMEALINTSTSGPDLTAHWQNNMESLRTLKRLNPEALASITKHFTEAAKSFN